MPLEPTRGGALAACAVLAGGAALAWALLRAQAPPAGAVDVAWDRAACSRCRMLVSEPGFAAQLHTANGEVLFFDDPGCLLLHAQERGAAAVYFHHHREDAWIPRERVAFVEVAPTPMGYGLAAVWRDQPAALDYEAARQRARAREAARTGGGS